MLARKGNIMRTPLTIISVALLLLVSACFEEESIPTSEAPTGNIDIHTPWPLSTELVEVPVAEDMFADNYVLIVDDSGSMDNSCSNEQKLQTAKSAAQEFVDDIPTQASVGMVRFGHGVELLVPLSRGGHREVIAALEKLEARGSTPMTEGIVLGYDELVRAGSAQLGYGGYHMIILGDGEPDNSSTTIAAIDTIVQRTPIAVTTIGFCTKDLGVMQRNGVAYYTAATLDELSSAFATVLAEAESFEDQGF